MGQLDDKTAIITGAFGGIGLEIAKRFHSEGGIPIATGEKLHTVYEFQTMISQGGISLWVEPKLLLRHWSYKKVCEYLRTSAVNKKIRSG
jgi:hypothetical protein